MNEKIQESAPIRDQVAHIIRRQILDGELQPGSQISERQISAQLEISTTPVKEALRVLQSEGLIITKPRKGSYVAKITKDTLLTLTFMRGALEGVAAYWACIYLTDEEIEKMRRALDNSGEIVKNNGSLEALISSNVEFHTILRNGCRTPYLLSMLENMGSIDFTIRSRSLYLSNDEPSIAHGDHTRIYEAVKARNSKLAEAEMVKHVRRVSTFAIENENI